MQEIKRDGYLEKLHEKIGNGQIKVITGLRRSGKSHLLFRLFYNKLLAEGVNEDHIIPLAFDNIQNTKYWNPFYLDEYLRSKIIKDGEQTFVFLDEIQFVQKTPNPYLQGSYIGFENVLLGLLEIPNVEVYVTGSNSHMLSSDIATEFRGRADQIEVHPLSYKEWKENSPSFSIEEYMVYGGMPYLSLLKKSEDKRFYLKNLFAEIYIKDILERYQIRNDKGVLDDLLCVIASSTGSLTNSTRLSNTFLSLKHQKIKTSTIEKYIDCFSDSFLLEPATRLDVKGKSYIAGLRKYYFTDIGLRNALLDFSEIASAHIMENMVYNELRTRGLEVRVGSITYDYKGETGKKEKKNLEIDFVCTNGNNKAYIQCAYDLPTEEKRIQETRGLLRIKDGFRKVVVLKQSIEPRYDQNGILYVGLEDFLLKDYLGFLEGK